MKDNGLYAVMLTMVMVLSSLGAVFLVPPGTAAEEPPSRAVNRYFTGKINNLDAHTVGNFNDTKNVTISGMDSSNNVIGPFWTAKDDWDHVTFYWTVEVDIQSHDPVKPWIIAFADRYGWNRTGGGSIAQNPGSEWYSGTSPNYALPPDSMEYIPGVTGDLMFTVLNGSSGAPLEGVGFTFDKHPLYNTLWNQTGALVSGNLTDVNGEVLFQDMQLGRDQNNNVKVRFVKEHFNTADKTGVGNYPLYRNVQSNYNVTLIEDPLVYQFSPAGGAVDVETNKTKVKGSLFVRFFAPMNRTSVDGSTVYLQKVGGAKVPVTYEWDVTDTYLTLQPGVDLEYHTEYSMVIKPRVRDKTDSEPLWRTFTTTFTTHKRPAIIRGTINLKGTADPAPEGSMVRLNNNPPVLLVNGAFNFSNVIPGAEGFNVTALGPTVGEEQQYMYVGNWKSGIMVQRGDVVDVAGLYVERRPTRTLIFRVADKSGMMLEGVSVTHLVTGASVMTDGSGVAMIEDVLKEKTTRFMLSKENYYTIFSFPVGPGWENTAMINITLTENEMPLTIKAWTDSATDLDPTAALNIISVEAYFRAEFNDDGTIVNMDPQTMTSDNIRLLRDGTQSVTIDIEHDSGDMSTWTITPRNELAFSTNYTLVIGEEVADQFGNNPLWRDYVVHLRTQGLDPASINGKVTIRDRGVEGIPVSAYLGETLLKRTTTGPSGFYILDITLTQREVPGVRVEVDGSSFGLSKMNMSDLVLRASGSLNNTDFSLGRVPGWFTVSYPKDYMGLLEIDGSITLGFKNPLSVEDMETFMENFTMRGVSDLTISLSTDKRAVILDPARDLEYDRAYELSVSYYPDGESQRELLFSSGTPALLGGERLLINTTLKPIEVIVSVPSKSTDVSRSANLVLYFTNYSIDASKLQPKLVLRKVLDNASVTNLTYKWDTNGRTLEISHAIFDIKSEYELFIPMGIYGVNGAMLRTDFIFTFTTEATQLDPPERPTLTIPGRVEEGKRLTLQTSNNAARTLSMVVEIRRNDQTSEWSPLENFTLSPLEEDKVISLDLSGMKKGEYQLRVRAMDPMTGALLDEQTLNFQITEEDGRGTTVLLWIWIVIAIIVIVIVVLGIYLFTQSRKKDIDEELKEEFECPECHNVVSAEDTVCPHCGAEFEESAYKCPKCGAMLDHEAEECTECGYDFSDQEKMEMDEDEEGEDISEMYEEDEEEEEEMEELEEDDEEEDDEDED